MGMIIPIMGNKQKARRVGLADALFSPVQQKVLALLFGQPHRRFQSAELIRLAGSGTGAAHRQLARLADVGLVTITRIGNQKHYEANRSSPVFEELHGLVLKTVGLVEPLRSALAPVAREIHAAFVYGSVAKGTDRASSDVDLLVISDVLTHADLFEALAAAERVLARAVNPIVMTLADWRVQRATPDSFAARVAALPRLFVVGSEHELG